MENVQKFIYSIIFFSDVSSRVLTKLVELSQSRTVILDDLAIVKAVLLLIRTLPEDDAAQLFRPQIFDEKTDCENFTTKQQRLLSISQILAVAFYHPTLSSINLFALHAG